MLIICVPGFERNILQGGGVRSPQAVHGIKVRLSEFHCRKVPGFNMNVLPV